MPTIVPVRFRYAARNLWFDAGDSDALEADHAICLTERGTEIGIVMADPREVTPDELVEVIGNATLKPVLRVATDDDLERAEALADKGDAAMPTFRRLVSDSGLDMKPVGVEYLFEGDKVVCYFAAEERVDFRQLVRELSRELHGRVDMRQIGVREEAAIVGGWGHCGQELCCTRFGLSFEPVSIRMAKEQDLPLNSTKISGACGRLMCCLRYEFEAYRDFKGRAPKKNAVIDTPLGKGKIVEYDTPKEQIAIRIENGKVVRIPLADMVASDAAVKKSQDLGCPCRPDTVTRDALERLQSPDVQMALAELDRKMGVTPKESFDESDIFVSSRPRRRRREDAKGEAGAAGGGQPQAEGQQPRRRSRRRGGQQVQGEQNAQARRQDSPTRRQSQELTQGTAAEGSMAHRRRRHRSVEAGVVEQAADKGQRQPQDQQQPRAARRRHPGDKAGQQQAARKAQPEAPKAPQQPKDQQAAPGDGSAPKRRRRHRGGRGKGGAGGNAEGGTVTGE